MIGPHQPLTVEMYMSLLQAYVYIYLVVFPPTNGGNEGPRCSRVLAPSEPSMLGNG